MLFSRPLRVILPNEMLIVSGTLLDIHVPFAIVKGVDHNYIRSMEGGFVMDRLETLFILQNELAEMYRQHRPEGFYAQEPMTRCTTWTRALIHEAC